MCPDVHRPEESKARDTRGPTLDKRVGHEPRWEAESVGDTEQNGPVPRQQDGGHRKEFPRRVLIAQLN